MARDIFEEGSYCLRRMEHRDDDYALLARWLSDARVLNYYEGRDNPFTLEQVREKYAPRVLAGENVTPCIIEFECQPLGYLQFYPADVEEYHFEECGKAYALDLFIGEPAYWGRGIGTQIVRLLLVYLFEQVGADWVLIDPHVDNPRAVRSYEKAGFRKIKILPAHEMHEGRLVDCWLMAARWDSD